MYFVFEFLKVFVFVFKYYSKYLTPTLTHTHTHTHLYASKYYIYYTTIVVLSDLTVEQVNVCKEFVELLKNAAENPPPKPTKVLYTY